MDNFKISKNSQFSELDFNGFNRYKFSVYIIDSNWNYLFINAFVQKNLGSRGDNLVGKNMWEEFPELVNDPSFMILKNNTDKGVETNLVTTSPINSQKLNILGFPLKDCTLFFSIILPNKQDLIHELRDQLSRKSLR